MTSSFCSYIDPGTYRSCLNHTLYASWMDPPKKIHDQENVVASLKPFSFPHGLLIRKEPIFLYVYQQRKTEHSGISTHINKNQAGKSYLKHEKSTSS
ncbi:hypothetical protein CDL12_19056 [Handroanthus impetiginosus]|uniref:Uncharacterized protein n=1 Tax=Handroanthus impetiginosus TaxID=429701 RepID=A0A2G9GTM1_9LAMI|nr:hypothetical protein CDL12_19056 [Handroanthus impetiginosus]